MNKKIIFPAFLLWAAAASAALTPGRYEIQNLGGLPIGTLSVTAEKTTYDDQPATRVTWNFVYTAAPYKSTEKHEAIINKSGLVLFRKMVTDDAGKIIVEGAARGGSFVIHRDEHGKKFSTGFERKEAPANEYTLDMDGSPFSGMDVKQARSAGVFSVIDLVAVQARRNVNGIVQLSYQGKYVPALLVSTAFSKTVTTSWFSLKTHELLKEQWPDRQFIRTGN